MPKLTMEPELVEREEMGEEQKRILRREDILRRKKEKIEDTSYEEKERRKLERELKRQPADPMLRGETSEELKSKERAEVEEFLSGGKELERLMLDPSIMQQPLTEAKCMNAVHDIPESADFKLLHGGLLGDTPPITLCKYCAKLMKLIPLESEDVESASGGKVYRKEELMKKRKSTMQHIFKKLADLASALDTKGLYEEASLADEILKKAMEGIDDGMSYEECKELMPNLTKENYDKMSRK